MSKRVVWISILVVGCGGASSIVPVAYPEEEGGPPALTEESVDCWSEARRAYDAALASGFDAAACERIPAELDAASAASPAGIAEAVYMGALARQRCGDAAGASAGFHRALTLRSTLCGARVAVALEAEAAGRADEARRELERAVHDDARCAEGFVFLARLQRRQPHEQDEALGNLRRALAIDARSMAAFDQMALVYLDQAMRARGPTRHVQGGGVAPTETPDAHVPDAASRLLDLAAVVCRQGQLIDADYAPLYNTWALIEVQSGHIVEALAMLERAMALDPSSFEAAMNFGELTLSFRGYEDARAAFERASTLRPSDYDALVGLGAARRGLGDPTGAEAAYTRAIAVDGSRPEAYFDLGLLYQDHLGGDVASMQRAASYYREFVSRADAVPELAPVVEAVTRTCPAGAPHRRRASSCTMGRLQQISEALALMQGT